jgi:hypothetical protein
VPVSATLFTRLALLGPLLVQALLALSGLLGALLCQRISGLQQLGGQPGNLKTTQNNRVDQAVPFTL